MVLYGSNGEPDWNGWQEVLLWQSQRVWKDKFQALPCWVLPSGKLYHMWGMPDAEVHSVSYLGSLFSLWKDAAFIPSSIHLNLGRTEVRRNPRKTIHDRESSDHIHMWREGMKGRRPEAAQPTTAHLCACQFLRLTSVSVLDHILGVPASFLESQTVCAVWKWIS